MGLIFHYTVCVDIRILQRLDLFSPFYSGRTRFDKADNPPPPSHNHPHRPLSRGRDGCCPRILGARAFHLISISFPLDIFEKL